MIFKRYKQYYDGCFVITSHREDIFEDSGEFLRYACDTMFNDDFYGMEIKITEIDTGDYDIGDCVRLVDDMQRDASINRSRLFCDNYMRVFGSGFAEWSPVRAELTPEDMKLFYFRFGGEDGLCDEYEALRMEYPDHIKAEISIEKGGSDHERFVIRADKKDGAERELTIEEYSGNSLICTRWLKRDEKGVYAEVDETKADAP